MDLLSFTVLIIVVTASGALAPGPLFFATISYGSKSGAKTGLVFSIAHTVVEFSLIMLLALGLLTVASEPLVKQVIGAVGGTILIIFGAVQIRNSIASKSDELKKPKSSSRHLFILGMVFTGLNPYFKFNL